MIRNTRKTRTKEYYQKKKALKLLVIQSQLRQERISNEQKQINYESE